MKDGPYSLNIEEIQRYLPHRAPFLLIDRVLYIEPQGNLDDMSGNSSKVGIKVRTLKNVSYNEPYMKGHFPDFALVPGVLLLESMAQTASFSLYPYLVRDLDKLARDFKCILVGVDKVRFRKPAVPGDTLIVDSCVTKCRGKLWVFECKVSCEGSPVANAEIMANLLTNEQAESIR